MGNKVSKQKKRNYRKLPEILYLFNISELATDKKSAAERQKENYQKIIQPKAEVNIKERLKLFSQIQSKLNQDENE